MHDLLGTSHFTVVQPVYLSVRFYSTDFDRIFPSKIVGYFTPTGLSAVLHYDGGVSLLSPLYTFAKNRQHKTHPHLQTYLFVPKHFSYCDCDCRTLFLPLQQYRRVLLALTLLQFSPNAPSLG